MDSATAPKASCARHFEGCLESRLDDGAEDQVKRGVAFAAASKHDDALGKEAVNVTLELSGPVGLGALSRRCASGVVIGLWLVVEGKEG